ncbi:AIPR family protein [Pedobacter sp. AK013]|uniref:AIPR family protein n=1 Tax=Pedobacter sp. AK013 TaxID=2723071 RepID=UPI00351C2135
MFDYQIVNGCQTSNVLYNNKSGSNVQKVHIPIKLIATTDDDVKTRITLATNNQTPIKKEQLAALTAFQRTLEEYYNSYSGEDRIYYERRAKQFNSDSSILKTKIITLPFQIKSFASMFLNEPHNVTSFFGLIVRRLNEKKMPIFNEDHAFAPYYLSAFAYYKLEGQFRRNNIDRAYKKVKFHILMLFRLLNESEGLPPLNNQKKMEGYCGSLYTILSDDAKSLKAFKKCINIIDNADFNMDDKQDLKLVSKTKNLVEYALANRG